MSLFLSFSYSLNEPKVSIIIPATMLTIIITNIIFEVLSNTKRYHVYFGSLFSSSIPVKYPPTPPFDLKVKSNV
jgi:hypothetical protein